MSRPFPTVPLADLASLIQYGFTASASAEPVGPKFLRITDIVPSRINWSGVPFCEITAKDHAKYRVEPGDIVIARTGATVGYAKQLRDPPDAVFASYLVRVRVSDACDARFIGCVVESAEYKRFIASNAGGAAQPNANAKVLTSYPVPLPPLAVQRKIAALLTSYEDLIENNSRRIEILDRMAQASYREWFVEFRYPGHEGVPLVDSDLGPIPESWTVLRASEAVEINPRVKVDPAEDRPFVPMTSVSESSMHIQPIERRSGSSGAKFVNDDTLFARITPCLENGKTAFVQSLLPDEVGSGSTELIVLRNRHLCPEAVYLLARSASFRDHAIKSMSGATGRQRVRSECFDDYRLAVAPRDLMARFADFVAPMFALSYRLHLTNESLRSTRDLLLPRLISGEVDVSGLDLDGLVA